MKIYSQNQCMAILSFLGIFTQLSLSCNNLLCKHGQVIPYSEGQISSYLLTFKIHERTLNLLRATDSHEVKHVQDNAHKIKIYCKIDSTVKICNTSGCQMRPGLKR